MQSILCLLRPQLPFGTPNPDDSRQIDLSNPFDLIVFIVLPIVIIILYVLWRKQKKNDGD